MSASAPRTVLVTGASGALGSVLTEQLPASGWAVRPLARRPDDALPHAVVGSVTDLDTMRRATEGVSAIVHMGGISTPGSPWEGYLDTNIHGTWTVLEAARLSGVPRVVLASSNHAVGYLERAGTPVPADAPPRPDSLYGVSKAAMEALGAFYSDEHGLTVANLRIGSSFPRPTATRQLATWLSYPDLVRLVLASIDGDWTGFRTVWGISRNTRRWWSLEEGERIGYHPQDDAELYADEVEGEDSPYVGGAVPPTRR
ncbi:NAD(P)-dependent oxidoreductase [Naasia sp. SYSU D00057]|uniref:NAD-dependent epimerase/dehydratase family protein n=1 Tax=Naasia sp. SYSU D00057 TaxID=2817380 RepID=UPI001B30416E|nr:NAD(P)-dependent oxidoreductase [Naasia sp. SYSU D00057]